MNTKYSYIITLAVVFWAVKLNATGTVSDWVEIPDGTIRYLSGGKYVKRSNTDGTFYVDYCLADPGSECTSTVSSTWYSRSGEVQMRDGQPKETMYTRTDPQTGNYTEVYCLSSPCNASSTDINKERVFNSNNNLVASISYQTIDDERVPYEKVEYLYDNNNLINTKKLYNFDGIGSEWVEDTTFVDERAQLSGPYLENEINGRTEVITNIQFDQYGNIVSCYINGRLSSYNLNYDKYGNVISGTTNGRSFGSFEYDTQYLHNQWLAHRKLIYTIEEANAIAKPNGNRVSITYR